MICNLILISKDILLKKRKRLMYYEDKKKAARAYNEYFTFLRLHLMITSS
jgi:hypothetical protein